MNEKDDKPTLTRCRVVVVVVVSPLVHFPNINKKICVLIYRQIQSWQNTKENK